MSSPGQPPNPPGYIPGYHAWPGGPPIAAIYAEEAAAAQEEAERTEAENLLLIMP